MNLRISSCSEINLVIQKIDYHTDITSIHGNQNLPLEIPFQIDVVPLSSRFTYTQTYCCVFLCLLSSHSILHHTVTGRRLLHPNTSMIWWWLYIPGHSHYNVIIMTSSQRIREQALLYYLIIVLAMREQALLSIDPSPHIFFPVCIAPILIISSYVRFLISFYSVRFLVRRVTTG